MILEWFDQFYRSNIFYYGMVTLIIVGFFTVGPLRLLILLFFIGVGTWTLPFLVSDIWSGILFISNWLGSIL